MDRSTAPQLIAQFDPKKTFIVHQLQQTADGDEFDAYAIEVEKYIAEEKKLTLMRLHYLRQLPLENSTSDKTCSTLVNYILNPEDNIDSDTTIILSAIEEGNVKLFKQFLKELKPDRRSELLETRLIAKYGATFLQTALEHKNMDIFRTLRVYMDKAMKKRVAQLQDNLGNNALHDACLDNSLLCVQQILANFTRDERPWLIQITNNRGDNSLKISTLNPTSEVFIFLLTQFKYDESLWNCIMTPNKMGKTVSHGVAVRACAIGRHMFTVLCELAKHFNKVVEFLFQSDCETTLLHSLVQTATNNVQEDDCVINNLKQVLDMADNHNCMHDLIFKCCTQEMLVHVSPLYLRAIAQGSHHSQKVISLLLSKLNPQERIRYIMTKEGTTGQNALHAAVKANNVPLLRCLLNHIQPSQQMTCVMSPSSIGNTPLHIAAGESATIFTEILTSLNVNERYRLILSEEHQGNTPILIAFIEGNVEVVNALMREDWVYRRMVFPLMCARNHAGWTIIHLSCMRLVGDPLTTSVLRFLNGLPGACLKTLITHVDYNGNTVLHLAALLYRPGVIDSVMTHLKKSEHARFLSKRNHDDLVASQLCNMPDLVVTRYLQPLKTLGWSDGALMAKRDYALNKSETQLKLKKLEEQNRLKPTPLYLDSPTEDNDDFDFPT